MSFYGSYPHSLSVGQLKQKVERFIADKSALFPVKIEGKQLATTFWGKSWNQNLESYQDYKNRLSRGRSYARHGAVVDLRIKRGQITAQVLGSSLYKITIDITPMMAAQWSALCSACSGKVGSLMELLQGKLSKEVMQILCQRPDGIFPSPNEIRFRCSCPDMAYMCKHVAATLYGVGSRLDNDPSLFFQLRSVEEKELIGAASIEGLLNAELADERQLSEDLSSLFGVEIVSEEAPRKPKKSKKKSP